MPLTHDLQFRRESKFPDFMAAKGRPSFRRDIRRLEWRIGFDSIVGACGVLGVRCGVAFGFGLRGSLCHHADRLDGRSAHAVALSLRARGRADCRYIA
jgi:hypothetical protein